MIVELREGEDIIVKMHDKNAPSVLIARIGSDDGHDPFETPFLQVHFTGPHRGIYRREDNSIEIGPVKTQADDTPAYWETGKMKSEGTTESPDPA